MNPGDKADAKNDSGWVLTDEEQAMIDDCQTDAERRALECIIKYAYIVSDSPTYIDVKKAHIDGKETTACTNKSIILLVLTLPWPSS